MMEDRPPTTCGSCGYDLSGLPPEGRCPECGQVYSRTRGEGLAPSMAGHERGARLVSRGRTLALLLAAGLMLAVGGLAAMFVQDWARPMAIAGLLAGVCLLAAVTSYLYE